MNQYLEVTNLKPDATMRDIETLCDEAIQNHYASVCIPPYYVPLASSLLKNTSIEVATIVGDRKGYQTTAAKAYEAIEAVQNGATEIGFAINTSAIKNEDYNYVKEEIEELRDSIDGKTLKVIIDISILSEEELIKIVQICNETFVHYIEILNEWNTVGDIQTIIKYKGEVLELKINGNSNLIVEGITRIGVEYTNLKGESK